MALLSDYTIPNTDVVVPKAYHRVEYISGNKELMNFHVKVYSSEKAYLSGHASVGEFDFSFKLPLDKEGNLKENQSNFLAMAYEHMKSRVEFADAKDI